MEHPTDRPASARTVAAARRTVFGFGVREIGIAIVALGVLAAAGVWTRNRVRSDDHSVHELKAELAVREDAAGYYREKFAGLAALAEQYRAAAEGQRDETARNWARERSRRFDLLLARFDHEKEARLAQAAAKEVARLLAQGSIDAARARLQQIPPVTFPSVAEFERLRAELYEAPLAEFSRQNPALYRAFRQFEPAVARRDELALRSEIAAANTENVTPQTMLKVELLTSVAAPDDPVVAEWSAMTSAIDYFEDPDGPTLAHWRRAQQALRANDSDGAAREMQAIIISKVRTRQPFRAAYGRALLRSRPDNVDEAYPYLAEAASAGDKQARAWVANEDFRQGRFAKAKAWLEAALNEGDRAAVPLLLDLHEKHADALPSDPEHDIGVLRRVTDQPEAPAEAWLLLGRLYERADVPGSAPKAYACFVTAASKGSSVGSAEVARCALRAIGTPENLEQARDAACKAFAAGERDRSVDILNELMRRAPERTAGAVQRMFEHEQSSGPAGYMETRIVDGPGVTQLKGALARYLDRIGMYGAAARLYASSPDAASAQRRAELTLAHPCQTCGGKGKVLVSAPCPTCDGKGRQVCSFCGGNGFTWVPGSPPCTVCGGAGTVIQDRKPVACSTCGGTGKGKGSVVKQDCTHCEHGYIRCAACDNGVIKVPTECPDCHGRGSWSLVDRSPAE